MEAKTNVNSLNLSLNDLVRMKMEFYDYYFKLFEDANLKLRKSWALKLKAIKACRC